MTPHDLAAMRACAHDALLTALECMQAELRSNVGFAAQCGKRTQIAQLQQRLHIIQNCEPRI